MRKTHPPNTHRHLKHFLNIKRKSSQAVNKGCFETSFFKRNVGVCRQIQWKLYPKYTYATAAVITSYPLPVLIVHSRERNIGVLKLVVPGVEDNLVNFEADTTAVRSKFERLRKFKLYEQVHLTKSLPSVVIEAVPDVTFCFMDLNISENAL